MSFSETKSDLYRRIDGSKVKFSPGFVMLSFLHQILSSSQVTFIMIVIIIIATTIIIIIISSSFMIMMIRKPPV